MQADLVRQLITTFIGMGGEAIEEAKLRADFEHCFDLNDGKILRSVRLKEAYHATLECVVFDLAKEELRENLKYELEDDGTSATECLRTFFTLATLETEGGASISEAIAALQGSRVSEASVRAALSRRT